MVLSVLVIQAGWSPSIQNATSLSLVAFDKSAEASGEYAGANLSQGLVLPQKQKERTMEGYFNVFESIRTRLHQSHYPMKVFLEITHIRESPNTDGVWKAQRSTSKRFHPF